MLTPNDSISLEILAECLHVSSDYEVLAMPFEWKLTRDELNELVQHYKIAIATSRGLGCLKMRCANFMK